MAYHLTLILSDFRPIPNRFRDRILVLALPKEAVTTQQDGIIGGDVDIGDHAQPIGFTVEKEKLDVEAQTRIVLDAKYIMRKEILLEKQKMRSHRKVDFEMVSDPLGTIPPGLISDDLAVSGTKSYLHLSIDVVGLAGLQSRN